MRGRSSTRLISNQHPVYRLLRRYVKQNDTIKHELEFVRADVHTQNIDHYWSIFERGSMACSTTSGKTTCPATSASLILGGIGGRFPTASGFLR